MYYLIAADVLAMNERIVGSDLHVVLDFGAIDAAVHRPMTTIGGMDAFGDIHEKGAALFHGLTKCGHGFMHGNKRTAVVALVTFYKLNGWQLDAEQGEIFALALATAEGLFDVPEITAHLKEWAVESWGDDTYVDLDLDLAPDDSEY